jgi:hypothetical protein
MSTTRRQSDDLPGPEEAVANAGTGPIAPNGGYFVGLEALAKPSPVSLRGEPKGIGP